MANVVEDWRGHGKRPFLDLLYEGYAIEEHEVVLVVDHKVSVQGRAGLGERIITDQLAGSENERREVVVIQSPHPLRSRWLQIVLQLNFAHQENVVVENLVDDVLRVPRFEHTYLLQVVECYQER